MNKDNAHQYLPLVQALADGKTIQFQNVINNEWEDNVELRLEYSPEYYRIKPEPRTFEMWVFKPSGNWYRDEVVPENKSLDPNWERITVREVIK